MREKWGEHERPWETTKRSEQNDNKMNFDFIYPSPAQLHFSNCKVDHSQPPSLTSNHVAEDDVSAPGTLRYHAVVCHGPTWTRLCKLWESGTRPAALAGRLVLVVDVVLEGYKFAMGLNSSTPKTKKYTFSQPFLNKCTNEVVRIGQYNHLSSEKALKSHVLHTVLIMEYIISSETAGEIWNWWLSVEINCSDR